VSAALDLSLGAYADAIERRLERLAKDDFPARLWRHDDSLWGDDPERRKVAANRLGWLDVPAQMTADIAGLESFADEVANEGFTHAVLLGMGGSSLAPEVLRTTFGVRPGRLDLTVLDNTSPAAVRAILNTHDLTRTLFVVSSKSGGTLEVVSFERTFFAGVAERVGGTRAPGRSFLAITDPGTSLERLAESRGYRRVFRNPPDIGGRYSALSYFGLVPAALIGVDLEALLASATTEASTSGGDVSAARSPAMRLGAALGELALEGRDKVTFVLGQEIAALGSWLEQLIAESTGKQGRGIVPIADEPLAEPEIYGTDRVFVAISASGLPSATERSLAALRAAGHPVLTWTIGDAHGVGGEFLRWEIATAVAGAVIGVDPFDEPNVTEAKQATQAVLERSLAEGRFPEPATIARDGDSFAAAPAAIVSRIPAPAQPDDPAAWLPALLALAAPGDYVAILAYLNRTPARHERLQRLRLAARARTHLATTLGYGPRFLHSTGQLHKGGPNTGLFVLLTGDEGEDVAIPDTRYGFATLRHAQALGDYEVLERRGRRVIRIHLGTDIEHVLDRLHETLAAAIRA
jgi:glucose-6-phosphate isomerase